MLLDPVHSASNRRSDLRSKADRVVDTSGHTPDESLKRLRESLEAEGLRSFRGGILNARIPTGRRPQCRLSRTANTYFYWC
jgi:hypothetical protein